MKSKFKVKIITPETSAKEIIELSFLSGPSEKKRYEKIMRSFIKNSLALNPSLDKGIVYGLYNGKKLIASARIKQDEYTYSAVSIEFIAVKPEYRGQGLGTIFLKGLFKEIKERWNKKLAILATGESKAFYEKAGMSLLGKLSNKSGPFRFYMYKYF